ncbi:glycosyltransferase family 2 protein [Psychrobacillus sp. OK032]|uniref:glycosyltransferase family 2 protein n=1 Tax=Psychrobacillus sp. OK032 TaxID=1884358 RepID=UPI0008AECD55|nr:glycosyltransferase family 2 protein [Psychrobacillus sp. OK032]SES46444.1 Glycosyltransferase, GT2 family [Psychrobacillus sp. OK032]
MEFKKTKLFSGNEKKRKSKVKERQSNVKEKISSAREKISSANEKISNVKEKISSAKERQSNVKEKKEEDYELIVKNKDKKDIKVSIIMPSYNKYEYVSLSLYCLLGQTFDFSSFEVILVDDCSSDNTSHIPKEFDPPFKFKYVRPSKNQGRSRVRNLGIQLAEGEVIIFLDAEMLTEPNFIENHYKHHINDKNIVVSGAMHYRGIYTFLTSDFNSKQWEHIDDFVPRDPYFRFLYNEYKQNHQNSNQLFPLITKKDIDNNSFQNLSFPNWYFTKELNNGLSDFGLDLSNYTLPYIAFLTGDVSVNREMLDKVGYFDESFRGYGAEDWELGYRLYKNGARFLLDSSTFCYHQEHPTSSNNFPEAMGNLLHFMKKFPNFDVLALALEHKPALSFTQIHYVVSQYNELCEIHPFEYREFKQLFHTMLIKLVENLRDSKPISKLHDCNSSSEVKISKQLNEIKKLRLYALTNSFEALSENKWRNS